MHINPPTVPRISASGLKHWVAYQAEDQHGDICVHRRTDLPNHTDNAGCWCSPWQLSQAQVQATPHDELQRLLDAHFAVQ